MDAKLNRTTSQIAVTSLIFGVITVWFVLLPFLKVPEYFSGENDAMANYLFSYTGHRLWGRSLIFGLPGSITAAIALKSNRVEGGDKKIKNLATVCLILNFLAVTAALLLFIFTPVYGFPQFQHISDDILP
jgi:hypothetical protein